MPGEAVFAPAEPVDTADGVEGDGGAAAGGALSLERIPPVGMIPFPSVPVPSFDTTPCTLDWTWGMMGWPAEMTWPEKTPSITCEPGTLIPVLVWIVDLSCWILDMACALED